LNFKGYGVHLKDVHLYVGEDCGYVLLEKIFDVVQELRICSPWISKKYIEKLIDISKRDISIFIITSDDENNSECLDLLKFQDKIKFKIQSTSFVHSKIYIIDKELAIIGSANLTYTGLESKQNNYLACIYDRTGVDDMINVFNDLYRKKGF